MMRDAYAAMQVQSTERKESVDFYTRFIFLHFSCFLISFLRFSTRFQLSKFANSIQYTAIFANFLSKVYCAFTPCLSLPARVHGEVNQRDQGNPRPNGRSFTHADVW